MKKLLAMSLLVLGATTAFAEEPGPADNAAHMRKKTQYVFTQMDTNGDMFVSKDEYLAYAGKFYDDADAKHDGKVTVDELMDAKLREETAFKQHEGLNTSDTSSASKLKSN